MFSLSCLSLARNENVTQLRLTESGLLIPRFKHEKTQFQFKPKRQSIKAVILSFLDYSLPPGK